MRIFDDEESQVILFLITLFEERNELEKMIINLRKEVNARDLLLQKYTGHKNSYPTYIDLQSDTLASHYDNPVFKKHAEFLKDLA